MAGGASSSGAGAPSSPRAPPPGAAAAAAPDLRLLENLLNTDVSLDESRIATERVDELVSVLQTEIRMGSQEIMDETVATQEVLNAEMRSKFDKGRFDVLVIDTLVEAKRWVQVAEYLNRIARNHAADCVISVPNGTTLDLSKIHAELFFAPHRQHIFELVDRQDRATARGHFNQHLAPLWPADGRLSILFANVDLIIRGTLLNLPDVGNAAKDATIEIKDYLHLNFPSLKPEPVCARGRKKAESQVWLFGEKLKSASGTKGFRCYSCHRVFWNASVTRLREHLESGNKHINGCPAVSQCTLDRVAAIPRRQQGPAAAGTSTGGSQAAGPSS